MNYSFGSRVQSFEFFHSSRIQRSRRIKLNDSKPETLTSKLTSGEFSDFVTKVVFTLCQTFAHLVASESSNRDRLSGLGNSIGDQLADCLGRIFDERLVEQNKLFIEFVQPALDNFVDDLIWLVRVLGIVLRLRPRDLALFIQRFRGNLFARDATRFGRGDVHGDVLHQLLKLCAAGGEISLTVYFDQHAYLAAHVNVRSDHTFGSHTALFLLG